ncbi:MAG: efflux RND transporter periplasmic adaptor subunit [Melioribacteraceae bacterium]|jgi:HlyD family secretion protein|nr:efflux RND transporter periplasmic adaptor subunit [Melioribacteraceae bacterium]
MSKKKKKNSKKKFIIFGAIGVVIAVLVVLVITNSNNEKITSVQTEKVENRNITQVVSATGKISPEYQVMLRPEVTGEVVKLPVEEGDIVSKGQLLIRIKPEQYTAQRDRAKASLQSTEAMLKVRQASLDKVKSDYKRMQGLFYKELASYHELETAKSNYLQGVGSYESQEASVRQAEASLYDAQEQLDKTVIYSPIDGRITALNVELSERVLGSSFSQGTHLMTVADLGLMEARMEVDENDVVLISEGDTTNIEIDAFGDLKFKGLVSQIGNSAKTTGFGTQDEIVNFEVKIRLLAPNEKIRPGMSCDADIQTETRFDVISVPIQSVTARMAKPKEKEGEDEKPKVKKGKREKPVEVVFILEGNKVKKVNVEIGISDDMYIEIKSGLEGDEEIVNGPYRAISKELEDGSTVMAPKKDNKKDDKNEDADKEKESEE